MRDPKTGLTYRENCLFLIVIALISYGFWHLLTYLLGQ